MVGAVAAPLGLDDSAVLQKIIGNIHRAIQHAARIVAQIQHHAPQRPLVLLFDLLQGLPQVLSGLGLKLGDAQITESWLQQAALDALNLDHFPDQLDFERFAHAFPHDGQGDRRVRLAAHPLDRIRERHAFDRDIVQPDDQIAGADASPLGGGIVNRGDDLEKTVFLADLDAQAAKFAGGADLQILERLGVQKSRMRVQIAQHAANGVFQQILVLDRFDVVLLDGVKHAGERAQLIQRQFVFRRRFLFGPDRMHCRQRNARQKTQRQRQTVSGCSTHLHSKNYVCLRPGNYRGIFSAFLA